MAVPIYIRTNNVQVCLFLHIFGHTFFLIIDFKKIMFFFFIKNTVFLDNRHPDRCKVIPYCGFDLYFPDG